EHRRAIEILTEAQVFMPAVVPDFGDRGGFIVFSAMQLLARGETIGDAVMSVFSSGAVERPKNPAPRFMSEKREVFQVGRDEVVAVAKSNTYASRIANALNLYRPSEWGR